MELPDTDDIVQLKSQQTIGSNGQTAERWTLDVYAANSVRAKQRARVWVRTQVPTASNVFDPQSETEQSTLKEFFTDSFDLEFHEIEILVVRS